MAVRLPVITDSLRDGQNVRFRERAVQRRTAVSAGPETDHLIRIMIIGPPLKVFAFESGHIDQDFLRSGVARQR